MNIERPPLILGIALLVGGVASGCANATNSDDVVEACAFVRDGLSSALSTSQIMAAQSAVDLAQQAAREDSAYSDLSLAGAKVLAIASDYAPTEGWRISLDNALSDMNDVCVELGEPRSN